MMEDNSRLLRHFKISVRHNRQAPQSSVKKVWWQNVCV